MAQGREALREHMAKAHEHYVIQGRKTILLVDGLDHVSREVGLQSSILHELPRPDEVPEGFLIILSAQPQALVPGTIRADVGNAVTVASDRRVDVTGLAALKCMRSSPKWSSQHRLKIGIGSMRRVKAILSSSRTS